jgi:TrmH family RNA methyltransferase
MGLVRRITSRANPLVARIRDVARGRGPAGTVLLDGAHLVGEAIRSRVPLEIVALVDAVGPGDDEELREIETAVTQSGGEVVRVPATVMSAMSPVRHPSGIVALASVGPATLDEALAASLPLILVLDGIQDAGNVGAIVRAAEACGATGIVTTVGTADAFGWKALRGAMGSTFRLPVATGQASGEIFARLHGRRIVTLATVPRDGIPLPSCNLDRPIAVLLGSEGDGLSDELVVRADERITIPMRAPVESLNVAVSAALTLYEAAKQRAGHVPVS